MITNKILVRWEVELSLPFFSFYNNVPPIYTLPLHSLLHAEETIKLQQLQKPGEIFVGLCSSRPLFHSTLQLHRQELSEMDSSLSLNFGKTFFLNLFIVWSSLEVAWVTVVKLFPVSSPRDHVEKPTGWQNRKIVLSRYLEGFFKWENIYIQILDSLASFKSFFLASDRIWTIVPSGKSSPFSNTFSQTM